MAVLQDININVHGQPSEKRLQTFLRLSQNENGRMINFRVLGPPLPSNCTATFSGTKPDGNVYSKAGTVTGNFVVIEEDIQMTAVAGVWDAKLDIINGTHNIMTALIRVVVDADVVDPDAIASDSQLQGLVAEAKYYAEHARTDAYGSPLTAPTKAQMTDHTRVYVYTGSEPNMVAGNWYLWNGSAWVSGGVYNAVAVQTDTTLSVAGKAADGKATGDAIEELKEDLNENVNIIGDKLFSETPTELRLSSEGYRLNAAGYRIIDANYKLDRYRVSPGDAVKVVSDDRWQFQSVTDVPASGTQNIIGEKHGAGVFFETVPEGAGYVVLSTLITWSGASVSKTTSNIDILSEEIGRLQPKADYSVGNLRLVNNELFPAGDNLTVTSEMSGYGLDADGYRIAQDGNKLMRFRVFAGTIIKFACPDKCQFQSTDGVPATGTQYKIGPTYGTGEFVFEVPEGATYLIISTPSNNDVTVSKVDHFVDETLSKEWKAADARQTGNGIWDAKTALTEISEYVYTTGSELASIKTVTGYALNDKGYRVIDENRKLESIRCIEGTYVKVKSDHMFQFQSNRDVTASGTQYKIGRTYGAGTYIFKVPEGSGYVILSTFIDGSNAHVYKATSDIDGVKTNLSDSELNFSAVLNAYTSQVSDIPYPWSVTHITIGIDTTNEKFISGSGHALVLPIISGTSIRVKKPQTGFCQICFASDYPTANVDITHRTNKNSVGNIEFVAESQATDNYLVIYTHSTEIAATDCTFSYSQTARGTVELLPQLDEHMINLLKYRPVGKISKPYIAISCDDGLEPLATYTLPRIQYWNNYYNTDIPLHMALFDQSPVLLDPTYTALVVDMCENHNCSIGIHGTQPYTVYSSSTALYAYMKKQRDTIIEKTGVTPTSVLYPHNAYTDQIMVMSGAFCGICAIGSGTPPAYKYVDNAGRYFYVGEKTNLYEVNRFNISDTRIGSVAELKNVIDYAYEHNYVICPYFHDIDFTEHSEEANQFAREMFDTVIQYGMEKGIEFINFGDIRYLT